jgi:rod shape-determining protein MreC
LLKSFLKKNQKTLLFGLSCFLILFLFYINSRGTLPLWSSAGKQGADFIFSPVRKALVAISETLGIRLENSKDIAELERELRRTRQELLSYQLVHDELETVKKEKAKLEATLGFRQKIPLKSIPAKIILKDPQNLFTTLVINRGEEDGIREGDPVVGFTKGKMALVGKIIECESSSAKILTLVDPRSQIGVMIEATGDTAILKGQSPAQIACSVEYLDRKLEGLEGKTIVCSGIGGRYPRGIYIGEITEVIRKRYGLFQQSFLVPYINFFTLDEVFVMVKEIE